jgi:ribosome-binding protein aMBF1 (putative translation factor)
MEQTLSQKLEAISVPINDKLVQDMEFKETNDSWLQISRKIALKLLQYRRENNLTHQDMCQILNIDEAILRQMFKGCYNYDLDFITKIETKLDLKLIQIL